jgi:predicted transcriptional regulator
MLEWGEPMATAKQVAKELLEALPEDCTLEDISYHLYVRARVDEGLRDLKSGRHVPHEQVMREAGEWLRNR